MWITVGVMAVTGCGPVTYIVAINDAAEAVEEARQSGAGDTSTGTAAYDYWLAVEHLAEARELAGDAEYQAAMDLAETAENAGHRARMLMRERSDAQAGHEASR